MWRFLHVHISERYAQLAASLCLSAVVSHSTNTITIAVKAESYVRYGHVDYTDYYAIPGFRRHHEYHNVIRTWGYVEHFYGMLRDYLFLEYPRSGT